MQAKEDINFVVKDGRQTVHAASVERLFEKLLDPYYRGKKTKNKKEKERKRENERKEREQTPSK